MTELRAISG
jgi:hypothetical protein